MVAAVTVLGALTFAVTPVGAVPVLAVTSTTLGWVAPNSTAALPGLAVSGDPTDVLQATVATDLGTLDISTTTGLTLAYANGWTGTDSITFTGSQSDINTALATASLTTGGTTGTAHVSLTAMVAQTVSYFLASNQHFYEYVAAPNIDWVSADAAAKALTFQGQHGYLATIPDASVNDFISNDIANANDIWIGARVYESNATDGTETLATVNGVTYPRVWRWTAGADESAIAGQVISECANATNVCDFQNAGSFYAPWASFLDPFDPMAPPVFEEPNNYDGSGTVAYDGEWAAVTNWNGTLGAWNDLSPYDTPAVHGYVVEFGGKTNDDASLGTGFAGVVTDTTDVVVANAATTPSAPGIMAAAADSSVHLSWIPASDGGAAITNYQVSIDSGPWTTIPTTSVNSTVNGNVVTTVTATPLGLTNGTPYQFRIRAQNSVGDGAVSNTVSVTPVAVPGAPSAVSAARGNGSATVSFSAPAANGAPITGYTVMTAPGGATHSCSASPCVISGLTNGTTYTFAVTASNSVGVGPAGTSNAVVPATVPDAVAAFIVTAGDGSATLSFPAPAANGSPVTGYSITVSPGGGQIGCLASPCTITGLTNGTAYTFAVVATNAVGDSPPSPSQSAMPIGAPGGVERLTVTRADGQATVSWTAPSVLNGSTITGYTVTTSPGGASCNVPVGETQCVVTGLRDGVAYVFGVVVHSTAGDSPAEVLASTAVAPPVPTGLAFTGGSQSRTATGGALVLAVGSGLVWMAEDRRRRRLRPTQGETHGGK